VKHGTVLGSIAIGSMIHLAAFSSPWAAEANEQQRPNIIWVIGEDMGPDLGCWGTSVYTPNIDRLAADGMRFTRVFGTASVCMPNRTAMITGVTQTTLGSVTMRPPKQFMRPLPGKVKPLPTLMRERGYHTGNIRDNEIGSTGKDDWNFQFEGKGALVQAVLGVEFRVIGDPGKQALHANSMDRRTGSNGSTPRKEPGRDPV
jgi:arylsulfatase A-like enzyme